MSPSQVSLTHRVPFALCSAAMILLAVLVSVFSASCEHHVVITPDSATEQTPPSTQGGDDPDGDVRYFEAAGVCARCHVVAVVEWGISRHREVQTTCQVCHGVSEGHVANERNEVKPQNIFRGDAIAQQLCSTCHDAGCPRTKKIASCQQCHHVHALVHPAPTRAASVQPASADLERWQQYGNHIALARQHVERELWKSAEAAFQTAMKLIPGDRVAAMGLEKCRRRMDPTLVGFEVITETWDAITGLPQDVKVAGLDIPMRLAPPGTFDMGSDTWHDSRPVHTVRVDAFFLGRHEITQAQWTAVMGENPAAHQREDFPDSADMPIECVSWEDCRRFIQRLNDRVAGGGFRLPTEVEWEYACRAGGSETFRVDSVTEYAWCRSNSGQAAEQDAEHQLLDVDANAPRRVATRRPNRWGFYDMQGNVSEWCASPWRPYLDDRGDLHELPARAILRVVRGGSYIDSASALDPALRHAARPHRRLRFTGLRVARSVPP